MRTALEIIERLKSQVVPSNEIQTGIIIGLEMVKNELLAEKDMFLNELQKR